MITAKVLADSLSPSGKRLTTLLVTFPSVILAQILTHREFSRNTSSLRAIPTNKLLKQILFECARPLKWGSKQKGMVSGPELSKFKIFMLECLWDIAALGAMALVWTMSKCGLAKESVNRILFPFLHSTMVISSTEWANFFNLRLGEDAQPEIRELATQMMSAIDNSVPKKLKRGEWHLPFVTDEDRREVTNPNNLYGKTILERQLALVKVSAGRCARTSYLTHEGHRWCSKDIELCNKLIKDLHYSPLEHIAQAQGARSSKPSGNFRGGFDQYRQMVQAQAK